MEIREVIIDSTEIKQSYDLDMSTLCGMIGSPRTSRSTEGVQGARWKDEIEEAIEVRRLELDKKTWQLGRRGVESLLRQYFRRRALSFSSSFFFICYYPVY